MKEFVVECPKCRREALVTVDGPYGRDNGKLTCRNCMHSEKSIDQVRYKSIVKRHCDNCGKEFETVSPNQKEKVDEITIPCPHCGTTRTYKPKNEEYKIGYETKGQAADPIFGLPLWFQADVSKGDWELCADKSKRSGLEVMQRKRQLWTMRNVETMNVAAHNKYTASGTFVLVVIL